MCVGIPLQVAEMLELTAWCEGRQGHDGRELINMMLIGAQTPGTWVLTFQGTAMRVMTPHEAAQTRDALQALEQTMRGDTSQLDILFADLVNREPQLPLHLQAQIAKEKSS